MNSYFRILNRRTKPVLIHDIWWSKKQTASSHLVRISLSSGSELSFGQLICRKIENVFLLVWSGVEPIKSTIELFPAA